MRHNEDSPAGGVYRRGRGDWGGSSDEWLKSVDEEVEGAVDDILPRFAIGTPVKSRLDTLGARNFIAAPQWLAFEHPACLLAQTRIESYWDGRLPRVEVCDCLSSS